jgi:hypothetical protein
MSAALEIPACTAASYGNSEICISYSDGIEVRFPVSINRRLRGQPEDKLANIEIGHFGISWPDLDEDLSHAGLRAGRYGQP